jgi:threonine dehydrogenase-like Zn-dependent dehydrogenase
VALAVFFGARVLALDPEPYRRNLAKDLGAGTVLDPRQPDTRDRLQEALEGRGVLRAIECSGQEDSQLMLIELAAIHGWIAFVGENHDTIALSPSRHFIRKGLHVFGSWHMNVNDAPNLFGFLRSAASEMLISHKFGFDRAQEAFDTFAARSSAKVILKPWN